MRRALVLIGVIVASAGVACGGEGDDGAALPANRFRVLAAPFASELRDLGLSVTRAALVDADTGKPRAGATHFAVYVEPTGTYSADDFATGIETVTRVFVPAAFDRWPALESFDVCQEPLPGVDDREVPPPKTQVAVSRRDADGIDWADVGLRELLAQSAERTDDSFTVYADDEVSGSATFRQAGAQDVTPAPSGRARY